MDIVTKVLGVAVGFYVIRGALGRSKEGDLTKFLILLGIYLLVSFSRLLFKFKV
jgi:hypothetical protein